MAFLVTSLIFLVTGITGSLCTRICFNSGPSTNLLHLTLVSTATVCCWMIGGWGPICKPMKYFELGLGASTSKASRKSFMRYYDVRGYIVEVGDGRGSSRSIDNPLFLIFSCCCQVTPFQLKCMWKLSSNIGLITVDTCSEYVII